MKYILILIHSWYAGIVYLYSEDFMRTSTRIRMKEEKANKPKHVRGIRPPSNGKCGMPQIYDAVRFPHIANRLCAEYGFTAEQLAKVFGVATRTVNDWVQIHPEFKQAVATGKDEFDGTKVENALLKRALGYEFKEETKTKIWVNSKDLDGKTVKLPGIKTVTTTKELPPDPKSCMFWLVNRQRDRWKLESTVTAKGQIEHKHSGTAIAVTADLDKLDDKQLLALRDMVSAQQGEQKQIGCKAEDLVIDMGTIMDQAKQIQEETYDWEGTEDEQGV